MSTVCVPPAPPPGLPPPTPPRLAPPLIARSWSRESRTARIAMTWAPVQVVVVRRQPTVGVGVAHHRVEREPAKEAVDVEARLKSAAPQRAVGLRRVERCNRAIDVGPVLVGVVRLLGEVLLDEDGPAFPPVIVRLCYKLPLSDANSARSIGPPGTSIDLCRARDKRPRRRNRERRA